MKMNRKNPNTTLVFCPLRVIPVVLINIAIVIIVSVVVTVIVIYIVINISNAVLFFIESWYFAIGIVEVATAENEVEEDIFEDMLEAEIMEQPDRPRLLAAGFPSRSFVDPNTPSRSRPIGMSARVQERVEVQEGSMRKKKCVSCAKKFRDGLKRKSTVLKCTSCSELTHLRCAKNAPTPFYCSKCPNPRDQIEPLVRLPSLTDPAPLPLLTSTQVLDLEGIEVDFEGVTVLDTVAPVVQPVSPVVEPVSPVVEPVSPVFRKRKATIVDSTRITSRSLLLCLEVYCYM